VWLGLALVEEKELYTLVLLDTDIITVMKLVEVLGQDIDVQQQMTN
jgi:hypothetical protein